VIRNGPLLLDHGCWPLRAAALAIAEAGWAAADVDAAAQRSLELDGSTLRCRDRTFSLPKVERIWFLGAGKASLGVARAVETVLGPRLHGGVVVVPRGQRATLSRIQVLESDHPLPSEASVRGAEALTAIADRAGPSDLVVASVTGGSSSLVCAPPAGVGLTDLRLLYRILLASGADVAEVNTVRRQVCTIKGGRLATRIFPAPVINLTVSDVADDNPEFITDLTVQNHARAGDAIDVLRRHGLWDAVPASVQFHLGARDAAALPDLRASDITTAIVLTGATVVEEMSRAAVAVGYEPVVLGSSLEGESRGVGTALASFALESWRRDRPFAPPCAMIACGGETTVSLDQEAPWQAGGPNQELAVALAARLPMEAPIAALAVDTDGHDGGTGLAGALVDSHTAGRAHAQSLELTRALRDHCTTDLLRALGEGVETGTTGTNVNDMLVVLVGRPARDLDPRVDRP